MDSILNNNGVRGFITQNNNSDWRNTPARNMTQVTSSILIAFPLIASNVSSSGNTQMKRQPGVSPYSVQAEALIGSTQYSRNRNHYYYSILNKLARDVQETQSILKGLETLLIFDTQLFAPVIDISYSTMSQEV